MKPAALTIIKPDKDAAEIGDLPIARKRLPHNHRLSSVTR
jgi:hypothetical protein